MKLIAIGLNVLLIVTVLWMLATQGAPNKNEIFLIVMFFAAPISSIVALALKDGESWLGLYFKRKVLEEKQKIKNLGDPEK